MCACTGVNITLWWERRFKDGLCIKEYVEVKRRVNQQAILAEMVKAGFCGSEFIGLDSYSVERTESSQRLVRHHPQAVSYPQT